MLRGTRSPVAQLWCINPPLLQNNQPTRQIINWTNKAIRHTPYATIADHIAFLHGTMCYPELLTLYDAIDAGFLASFSEITSALVRKYPPARSLHHARAPRPAEDEYLSDNDTSNNNINPNNNTSDDYSPAADNQLHSPRCSHARGLRAVHIGNRPGLHRPDRPIPTPFDRQKHGHARPVLLRRELHSR